MIKSTSISRAAYLDIMDRALRAYPSDYLCKLIEDAEENGVREHGFFRITAIMGILIAHGRRTEQMPLFLRAMDLSCAAVWQTDMRLPEKKRVGVDFGVKELVFVLLEMRGRGLVPEVRWKRWFEAIQKVDWRKNYAVVAKSADQPRGNWGMYNAAGEYMREYLGAVASADEYLDVQIASQLLSVDENGMYMDGPLVPMLYDLASRAQFAVLLHFGYRGKWRQALDDALRKAGFYMLRLQSANGEIPYGGRSNQFLFNEAYLSACCEFEASRYRREGNMELAGAFKRAAHLAAGSIERWLSQKPVKHIKNAFPRNSSFGLESYAYFDKYMVTLGSFIYLAYLFADDSIAETEAPCERGGFVVQTSPKFHKIAATCGGYSIELDTRADFHYDATGLGRIHRCGAPSELALSVPFPQKPAYSLDDRALTEHFSGAKAEGSNPSLLSLVPIIRYSDGSEQALCALSETLSAELLVEEETPERVAFSIRWRAPDLLGVESVTERYILSADGLSLSAECSLPSGASLYRMIPLLMTGGGSNTRISIRPNRACVYDRGWRYTVSSDQAVRFADSGQIYANRNGRYRACTVALPNGAYLSFRIEKEETKG